MIWLGSFLFFFMFSCKEYYSSSFWLTLDTFSLFMVSIFPLVFLLITYSNFYSWDFASKSSLLFSYNCIFSFLLLTFCCGSFFYFLLGLEFCVFFMLKLILDYSKDLDKVSSSFFMFFMNSLGSIPFMFLSVFYLYNMIHLSFYNFSVSLNESMFIYYCFFLILISKVPIFLMHFWLTKAHVSASGTTSMVLASLMLKIGTFGIFKFGPLLFVSGLVILGVNCSVSLAGSILVCLVMLRYFDMKYVIACSSIVHMSFTIPMSSSSDISGSVGSIFMMLGHGLISYYLFFIVSLLYEISINRSSDFNKSLESFSKSLLRWFFVFLVLNLGFPPFISFLSEIVLASFFFSKNIFMVPVLMAALLLSVFFFIFLILKNLFGKKHLFFAGAQDSFLTSFSLSFIFYTLVLPLLF